MKINLLEVPVYYINLEDQDEKRKQTESMLKKIGFSYVESFSAIKHESGRIVGCARSHYEILSKDIKPPFIILEDDCTLNREFISEIDLPDDVDALYLGISHWGRYLNHSGPYVHYEKINDKIVRVYNMLATHSILYMTEEYKNMCKKISYYYGHVIENHLDIGFAEIHKFFNIYSFDNPIFRQYEWNSTTSGKISDIGLNKQKANELHGSILTKDDNYYKINETFKSPLKPLIEMRDVNGIPGYFLPTKLV